LIAHLHGELARVESDYAVIDVNGVGYKVFAPLAVLAQLPPSGQRIKLLVTTIVREDSITLYGFREESEQSLFDLLLTVSGVGPRVALNILSSMPVEQIVRSIGGDRPQDLNQVQGVGTKTAQRIVLDLKEKIATLVWAEAARKEVPVEQRALDDAIEGLVALGYNRGDARSAAEEAATSVKDSLDTGGIVRAALKLLAK